MAVKSKSIKNILADKAKFTKLLSCTTDWYKEMKYKRLSREVEYKCLLIDIQLKQIQIKYKDPLYQSIFIDRFINEYSILDLTIKYNLSESTVNRYIYKSIKVFESNYI